MQYSHRLITLMAAALAAAPLSAQSTRGGERAREAANSATEMPVTSLVAVLAGILGL